MNVRLISNFWPLLIRILVIVSTLAGISVSAQFAPSSVVFPSTASFSGTYIDPVEGSVFESVTFSFISATEIRAPQTTGTYSYLKTGSNSATLSYTANWSFEGDSETETSTVLLTFITTNGGTYTSSGSYFGEDAGETFSGSFTGSGNFTFNFTNTKPSISAIDDRVIDMGSTTGAISFTVDDDESSPEALEVSASSSDTTLLPVSQIEITGSGSNRLVTVTPRDGKSGRATITLTVDDGSLTATASFLVTVKAGEVTYSVGGVNVERGGVTTALLSGDPIFEGDTILTAASGGIVRCRLADGSTTSIGPNSKVIFEVIKKEEATPFEALIDLIKGKITSTVVPQENPNFIVKTKTAITGVRGTVFEVSFEELNGVGTTTVAVTEGVVNVTEIATGQVSILAGGESLQILSDGLPDTPSISIPEQGVVEISFPTEQGIVYDVRTSEDLDFAGRRVFGIPTSEGTGEVLRFRLRMVNSDGSFVVPSLFFKVNEGFAPLPETFLDRVFTYFLPGTNYQFVSSPELDTSSPKFVGTAAIYGNEEPGEATYFRLSKDRAMLVITYDEFENDSAVYFERLILDYTGIGQGTYTFAVFTNGDEESDLAQTGNFDFSSLPLP